MEDGLGIVRVLGGLGHVLVARRGLDQTAMTFVLVTLVGGGGGGGGSSSSPGAFAGRGGTGGKRRERADEVDGCGGGTRSGGRSGVVVGCHGGLGVASGPVAAAGGGEEGLLGRRGLAGGTLTFALKVFVDFRFDGVKGEIFPAVLSFDVGKRKPVL